MSDINSIILLEMQSLEQMMNSFKQAIVPPHPTPEQLFALSQDPGFSDLFQQSQYPDSNQQMMQQPQQSIDFNQQQFQ